MASGDGREGLGLTQSALFLAGGWSGLVLTWHWLGTTGPLWPFGTLCKNPCKSARTPGCMVIPTAKPLRPRAKASLSSACRGSRPLGGYECRRGHDPSVVRPPFPSGVFLAQPVPLPKLPPCKGGKKSFPLNSRTCFVSPQLGLTAEAVKPS